MADEELAEGKDTVLIIDDEPSFLTTMRKFVERDDFEAELFEDIEDAYERARDNDIACIIIDLSMPKIGGISFITRLRKDGYATPAIIVSGDVEPDDKKTIAKMARTKFFEKGNPPSELMSCLRTLLRSSELSEKVDSVHSVVFELRDGLKELKEGAITLEQVQVTVREEIQVVVPPMLHECRENRDQILATRFNEVLPEVQKSVREEVEEDLLTGDQRSREIVDVATPIIREYTQNNVTSFILNSWWLRAFVVAGLFMTWQYYKLEYTVEFHGKSLERLEQGIQDLTEVLRKKVAPLPPPNGEASRESPIRPLGQQKAHVLRNPQEQPGSVLE